jgi:antirestriction protein ArdC
MSRQFARAGFGNERTSLYQEITDKIIAELEAGRAPWVQPWGAATGAPLDMPRNAASGRRYSGINILILWDAVIEGGFSGQSWLTFRQALALATPMAARPACSRCRLAGAGSAPCSFSSSRSA